MNRNLVGNLLGAAAFALLPLAAEAGAELQPMQPMDQPQVASVDYEHCVTATGSHIKGDTCIAANGVSYERSVLEESGGVNWSTALRRDPSISLDSTRHH